MPRSLIVAVAALLLLSLPVPTQAEWSLPNLNPWSKSTPKTTRPAAKPASSGLNLWPSWGKAPPRSNQAGMMTKMQQGVGSVTTGTKNAFTRTTQALTPWKTPPAPVSATGSRSNITKTSNQKDTTPWWYPYPKEETKPRPDPSEFLKLDKPSFNN